jgi:hypothetical protein
MLNLRPTRIWTLAALVASTAPGGASHLSISAADAGGDGGTPTDCTAQAAFPSFTRPWVPPQPIRFLGNEFVPRPGTSRHFYCNPVRLDGRPVDWGRFSLGTTGKLTLVHGDPRSTAATAIPFTVSLRRNGERLSPSGSVSLNRRLEAVDLADVLALARPGDHLIIDPVNDRDWLAKRIIVLDGC